MKLDDALFNWLQIQVVAVARPDDQSAIDTTQFFLDILTEDHHVSDLRFAKDATMYTLHYTVADKRKMQMYEIEAVEQLLLAIENEPRYNQ